VTRSPAGRVEALHLKQENKNKIKTDSRFRGNDGKQGVAPNIMISTSEFKNGTIFEWDGRIWQVVWFQHHKPGKGGAVMRLKLKNMKSGDIIERTFKSGESFREVEAMRRKKTFSYVDGDRYHFVDVETYDDMEMLKETLGEMAGYLKENMEVQALYLDDAFLNIEIPASVQLKVIETVPGVRGNTVSNTTKPAKVETGIEVAVPLFINEGDVIKVDTRSGEYVERV
jgi:elongation factor P